MFALSSQVQIGTLGKRSLGSGGMNTLNLNQSTSVIVYQTFHVCHLVSIGPVIAQSLLFSRRDMNQSGTGFPAFKTEWRECAESVSQTHIFDAKIGQKRARVQCFKVAGSWIEIVS